MTSLPPNPPPGHQSPLHKNHPITPFVDLLPQPYITGKYLLQIVMSIFHWVHIMIV